MELELCPASKSIAAALLALGKAAHAALLPQMGKTVLPAGKDFVCIRLMSHIPDELILRKLQYIVKRKRQLHHT